MKKIFLILSIIVVLFSSDEVEFWNEVKNSKDTQMLKLYKEQYPNGIFVKLADLKIKRLKSIQQNSNRFINNHIPNWIHGEFDGAKYYGVGDATKHFKGLEFQKTLAYNRAKDDFILRAKSLSLVNTAPPSPKHPRGFAGKKLVQEISPKLLSISPL